jgi:hypothetical protein
MWLQRLCPKYAYIDINFSSYILLDMLTEFCYNTETKYILHWIYQWPTNDICTNMSFKIGRKHNFKMLNEKGKK